MRRGSQVQQVIVLILPLIFHGVIYCRAVRQGGEKGAESWMNRCLCPVHQRSLHNHYLSMLLQAFHFIPCILALSAMFALVRMKAREGPCCLFIG